MPQFDITNLGETLIAFYARFALVLFVYYGAVRLICLALRDVWSRWGWLD